MCPKVWRKSACSGFCCNIISRKNQEEIRQALRKLGRRELIGYGPACLVPPERRETGGKRGRVPGAVPDRTGSSRSAAGRSVRGGKGRIAAPRPPKGALSKKEKAAKGWALAKPKTEKKKNGPKLSRGRGGKGYGSS